MSVGYAESFISYKPEYGFGMFFEIEFDENNNCFGRCKWVYEKQNNWQIFTASRWIVKQYDWHCRRMRSRCCRCMYTVADNGRY